KVDGRYLVGFGIFTTCLSLWLNGHLTEQSSFWGLAFPQMVRSLGMGFIFIPLNVLTLSRLPSERRGNATGLFNLTREMGGSVGTAWMGVNLSNWTATYGEQLRVHVSLYSYTTQDQLSVLRGVVGSPTVAYGILQGKVSKEALVESFNKGFLAALIVF